MTVLLGSIVLTLSGVSCSKESVEADSAISDAAQQEEKPVYVAPEDEEEQTYVPEEGMEHCTLVAGKEEMTKTYIDGTNVKWEIEDDLGVFNSAGLLRQFEMTDASKERIEAEEYETHAAFHGMIPEGAESLWVVYPYSDAVSFVGDDKVQVSLPSEQRAGSHGASRHLIAVGKATVDSEGDERKTSNLALHNVFGIVKVTLTSSDVTSVVITGTNVAGTATVAIDTGEINGAVSSASNTVTLLPEEGEDYLSTGDHYIAVLPGSSVNTFKVALHRSVTFGMEEIPAEAEYAFGTKTVNIPRADGVKFTETALLTALSSRWTYFISTPEQLVAWNENRTNGNNAFDNNRLVKLTADMNLNGQTWTPRAFTGTFDGDGKKIYNITVNSPNIYVGLFSRLYGSVKNLVIGSSNGSSYDGVSCITHCATSEPDDWSNVGAVCGRLEEKTNSDNVRISNVTNYASLLVHANNLGKTRMGGMAGFAMSAETGDDMDVISQCKNYGAITNAQTTDIASNLRSNQSMGGIVGSAEWGVKLSYCVNYGALSSTGVTLRLIGGIIGVTFGKAWVGADISEYPACVGSTVSHCDNYGAISFTGVDDGELEAGGIAGGHSGGTIEYCENQSGGTISVSGTSLNDLYSAVGGIAGLAGYRGVGDYNKAASFDHCSNKANLSTTNSSLYAIAGIVGIVPQKRSRTIGDVTNTNDNPERVTFTHCINYGKVENKAAGAVETRIHLAGVLAFGWGYRIIEDKDNYITLTNCSNQGDITSAKPNTEAGYIGGVCGEIYCTSLTSCYNTATITTTGGAYNQNVGGLIGYANQYIPIASCYNTGNVKATMASSGGASRWGKVGGLVGGGKADVSSVSYNSGDITLSGQSNDSCCGGIFGSMEAGSIMGTSGTKITNSGNILIEGWPRRYAGGIVGRVVGGTQIRYAGNSGKVYANGSGHAGVGGIVGNVYLINFTIRDCFNEGTIENIYNTDNQNFRWAGGIVGRHIGASETVLTVRDCVNGKSDDATKGTVTQTVNSLHDSKPKGILAGGIVASSFGYATISACTNYAPVSLTNSRSGGYGFAGGIFGGDYDPDNEATGTVSITGNYNYGTVSTTVTGAGRAGAGGIMGEALATASDKYTGNYSRGSVSFSGLATDGGAGAVIGDAEGDPTGVTCTIKKTITVGGVSWATAEAAGTLSIWLCPNLTSSHITPYYED
ncbi:MAG: hypothetical protein IJU13_07280 [Bacteroidales bacterium]|nr:hypothetical protein [Bacteroidales bacterium]